MIFFDCFLQNFSACDFYLIRIVAVGSFASAVCCENSKLHLSSLNLCECFSALVVKISDCLMVLLGLVDLSSHTRRRLVTEHPKFIYLAEENHVHKQRQLSLSLFLHIK